MSLLRKCVASEIRGPCSHPQGWETALVWIKAQNREGPRRERGRSPSPCSRPRERPDQPSRRPLRARSAPIYTGRIFISDTL